MKNTNDFIISSVHKTENLFTEKKHLWDFQYELIHKKILGFTEYQWADSIYIPIKNWIELENKKLNLAMKPKYTADISSEHQIQLIAQFATISAWRHSKGIYNVSEEVLGLVENPNTGSIVSPKHFHNMREWAIYIPIEMDLRIQWREICGAYISKNILDNATLNNEPNCIIINFRFKHEPIGSALPFVILATNRLAMIEDSIIEIGGFDNSSKLEVIDALKVIIHHFNICFDESTVIESEIIGIGKPHYSDVDFNINFDDFNTPKFKYLSPSNTRKWMIGLNHLAQKNKHKRKKLQTPLHTLKWDLSNETLVLKDMLQVM